MSDAIGWLGIALLVVGMALWLYVKERNTADDDDPWATD